MLSGKSAPEEDKPEHEDHSEDNRCANREVTCRHVLEEQESSADDYGDRGNEAHEYRKYGAPLRRRRLHLIEVLLASTELLVGHAGILPQNKRAGSEPALRSQLRFEF